MIEWSAFLIWIRRCCKPLGPKLEGVGDTMSLERKENDLAKEYRASRDESEKCVELKM